MGIQWQLQKVENLTSGTRITIPPEMTTVNAAKSQIESQIWKVREKTFHECVVDIFLRMLQELNGFEFVHVFSRRWKSFVDFQAISRKKLMASRLKMMRVKGTFLSTRPRRRPRGPGVDLPAEGKYRRAAGGRQVAIAADGGELKGGRRCECMHVYVLVAGETMAAATKRSGHRG